MSELYNVGIDVSMDRLDVEIRPGGQRFWVANDTAGWVELVVRLRRLVIAATVWSRPAATNAASSVPCWRPASRCVGSTQTSSGNSPVPAVLWPRTTAS